MVPGDCYIIRLRAILFLVRVLLRLYRFFILIGFVCDWEFEIQDAGGGFYNYMSRAIVQV